MGDFVSKMLVFRKVFPSLDVPRLQESWGRPGGRRLPGCTWQVTFCLYLGEDSQGWSLPAWLRSWRALVPTWLSLPGGPHTRTWSLVTTDSG